MNSPLVSIIVPVYNVKKYLPFCIESILKQTYSNFELILINDGSTDESGNICLKYSVKDKRIKVLNQKNEGLSSARNAGIESARGDYFLFIDSDDYIDRELIKNDVELTREKVDIVFHKIEYFGNKTGILSSMPNGLYTSDVVLKQIMLDKLGSQVVRGLYKKELWENIRFPVGRLYEDLPTTFKVVAKSRTIVFTNQYAYNYRISSNTISTTFNPDKSFHIFKGFCERCDYCKDNLPSLLDACIVKTSDFAISAIYYHLMCKKNLNIVDAKSFLKINRKVILSKLNRNRKRKFLIFSYIYSFPFFYLTCLLIKIFRIKK